MEYNTDKKERQQIQYIFYRPLCIDAKTSLKKNEAYAIIEEKEMESAPARAQSRILPFRLSKTVQPAPHKGQRRWIPRFSGQISSADAKNGAKKRVFPKRLLSPRGTRAAGHRVPTHTMLRAALKPLSETCLCGACGPDTHNAACGIETPPVLFARNGVARPDTHNAACGIETRNPRTRAHEATSSRHTQCCVRH